MFADIGEALLRLGAGRLAICTRAARPLAGLQYRLSSKLTHRQRTSLRAKRSKAKQSNPDWRHGFWIASLLRSSQ
jgi:hypothetical protein